MTKHYIPSSKWSRKGPNLPRNIIKAKAVSAGKKVRVVSRKKARGI